MIFCCSVILRESGDPEILDSLAWAMRRIGVQLSDSDDDGNSKEMKVVVVSLYHYLFVDFARSGMSSMSTTGFGRLQPKIPSFQAR